VLRRIPVAATDRFARRRYGENDHLEDDTRDHEVGAEILCARARLRRGCQTAASALEAQRYDVACDEDVCVPSGTEPRPRSAECEGDVLESEVYAGGDECGGDDEQADLDLKTDVVVRVLVHHEATVVASGLSNAA
jgi:hypothetical protein